MSDPGPSNPSPSSATPAQPSPSQSEPAPQTPPTPSPTFYSQAANSAQQTIQSISRSLPRFPTPTLRVQRVNQLDAQLLDAELTELLLEPVKKALGVVKSTLPADLESELLLFLRLALFKFSIWDRGASYGSMLQNLKYRNEWAHRGGLQSTSTDQPLTKLQLCLYPLLTIILPYANTKFQDKVNSVDASSDLSPDGSTTRRRRRRILNLTDSFQRLWAAAALVNFAIFLSNGKYRTVTDRLLGMRLTYSQRTMNRNVSFEFLNRQLVWHAFTEFLLFLLPLVRPRRLLRRLTRLGTHPNLLLLLTSLLPSFITRRIGIHRDPSNGRSLLGSNQGVALKKEKEVERRGKYWNLGEEFCAICLERSERKMSIPTSFSSSQGEKKALLEECLTHNPYRLLGCGHRYCYYCIGTKLLDEEMEDRLVGGGGNAWEEEGWECLRCTKKSRAAVRVEVDELVEGYGEVREEEEGDEDDDDEEEEEEEEEEKGRNSIQKLER